MRAAILELTMRDGATAAVTVAVQLDAAAAKMPGRERAVAELTARAVADLLPHLLHGCRVDAIEATAAGRDRQSQADLVDAWNALHSAGRPVAVRLDDGREIRTSTRSAAQLLANHTAVVWVAGVAGAYALERVRPVVDVDPRRELTTIAGGRHHHPDQDGGHHA